MLSSQTAENYFYVPDLGQVPELDVPSYLPDLPGIADDLMYSADLGPGFAPSVPASNSIPELPSFGTEHDESSGSGGIIINIQLWQIYDFFWRNYVILKNTIHIWLYNYKIFNYIIIKLYMYI